MRLEWLEYFSDAARLGSIKASADKHNITPQGLSKCIRSLEKELGVKLFERDANSVRLTPEGSRLLAQVRATIDDAHELLKQARDLATGNAKAPLTIMCSAFVFMCGAIEPLREGVGNIGRNASYAQMHTSEIFAALNGKADTLRTGRVLCGISLLFEPLREQNEEALRNASMNGYEYLPLLTYSDGVLVSAEHPLAAAAESITRSALLNYPVVSSSVEQFVPLNKFLGDGHISSAISDFATRLQVIQDAESIIFVPPFSEVKYDPRYCYLPLTDGYKVEVGFLYDRNEFERDEVHDLLHPFFVKYAAYEQSSLCTMAPDLRSLTVE